MEYQFILLEKKIRKHVALIRLNRPHALNALNAELLTELVHALAALDKDAETRCIVVTGNDRAFAAGADIKQLMGRDTVKMHQVDQFSQWDAIRRTKTPLIAAVSGFALGGGCELSMLCDMIVASETAKFGQPEINIGVIPGAGGTQRLTRAIGKARAMEMVLTGRFVSAKEAYEAGLITKVYPPEAYFNAALNLASKVASMPPLAAQLAKEAINQAFETPLQTGLLLERRNYYMLFSSQDQKEGMSAFTEKRKPKWKGE